ncbi:cobalt-precorrin-6A reductase [Rhodoplanes sp. TEM]|uniref:Cobalt-precorrin-6A reductase n=1 Tax=Rhodoplanes tepidamans TaxID=200616 RepID=A0ABT5J877_RHOTP|nr:MULTISPECIES: cobalt-precorrin-6A reductase [Rhodoplanes]MDC7785863.1 cobalt-precorrin-6A reductase [Rhodoplanes tepidamans]MDC7984975.1 cobalt-precorrin-6A reductase [Rhodoplanes sp. TEM]MDQ0355520.1 precorrin-6A/cobalt-precorrin-6A reductase [Rhodoplanes tepidamans]
MAGRRQKVLVLGGTTEARRLAEALAVAPEVDAVLSYAGRTESPLAVPVPWRVGGFGGVPGLIDYLRAERIDRVVDATHPFAAQMSANAVAACAAAGVPLVALERAPWRPAPGDRWIEVDSLEDAVAAVGDAPRRVFLGIGRLHLDAFAARPQHHYLVRLVDAPRDALPLPNVTVVVARGPFDVAGDRALMTEHGSEMVVSKNAGGTAAVAKIIAARDLGLPVVMVRRPDIPARPSVQTVAAVTAWLVGDTAPEDGHDDASGGAERGV